MNKNKIFFGIGGIFLSLGMVYAFNTLRVYIPETTTTGISSYQNQSITTLSGASIIDKDNNRILSGDFFSGYYYDSAHGVFSFDELANSVSITNNTTSRCTDNSTHDGYELVGYSWNDEFGAVNFHTNNNIFVYICVPKDENSNLGSYLGGYAYSELVGFQNFDGIIFDVFVDRDAEHASDARYVKVDGVTSSQNHSNVDSISQNEVRVIGNITKSSLKKQVLQNVYTSIKNINSNNGSQNVSSLGSSIWSNSGGGKLLQNDTVLYFGSLGGQAIRVNGNDNIEGSKTLVVEGGNIYITGNIRNIDGDDAILGLIAIKKDGQGGNIYIDPSVTDIHANMYADKSIISYDINKPIGSRELDGNTPDGDLRNQLYIYGSIFSENTLGGADSTPLKCPFYINTLCDSNIAKKYDLNYLRRYILVTEMSLDPITGEMIPGDKYPANNALESYIGDDDNTDTEIDKPGYRVYPFIIEYNSNIQQNPPPFF